MRRESLIHKILRKLGFIKDIEDDRKLKMEMCRGKYQGFFTKGNCMLDHPKVFRFPADDEI